MNTIGKWLRRRSWSTVLLPVLAAAVTALGLMRLLPSLAYSPGINPLNEAVSPLKARRGFIGLPDANTFSIQNISTEAAHITLTIALPNGTVITTDTETVPPESIRTYSDPENLTSLARIETDVPTYTLAANYELGELGNDAYLGLERLEEGTGPIPPGDPLYLLIPQVMKDCDGWNTAFTIQNISALDGTVVVTVYSHDGSSIHSEVLVIPANGAAPFDLADISMGASSCCTCSAVIAGDVPLTVASVRAYHEVLGLRSAYQGRGSWESSNVLVAPALFKASDLQTSEICVQNGGTSEANVVVNYSDGLRVNTRIPRFAVHCFDQGLEGHAAGWSGGAVITNTAEPAEPLVAVANVTAYDGTTPVGRWSYTLPAQGMVTRTLALPLLFTAYGGWTSEIHLYNYNDSPAGITPRYVSHPAGFVYCADSFTIPAHSVLSISQAELPRLFRQSMAYFTATQPVAAVVSVTSDEPLGDTDRHFGYSAAYPDGPVSFPDTCDTIYEVFVPAILKEAQ